MVLPAVAAVSARDVWAAGHANQKTLTLRWDGRAWHRVPSPTPAAGGYLIGLAAVSPRDLWAVGRTAAPNAISANTAIIVQHWTGRAWQ